MPSANPPDVAPIYWKIGQNVRSVRERIGLSREDLAAQVGVSRTSISQFETGYQRLPLETVYLVAFALGVEISEILPPLEELAASRTDILARVSSDETLDTGERQALLAFFEQHVDAPQ